MYSYFYCKSMLMQMNVFTARLVLLNMLSFFISAFASAQQKVIADKIVAIVGDKIILQSDIKNSIADISRNGGQVPEDCAVLDQELISKSLVLQAEKDSLLVTDEEINAELDQKIRYFVKLYGGKEAVDQISGRSIYRLKEEFRPLIREQRLAATMENKIVQDIKITPAEVKEYYDMIPKDSLRFYESDLQIGEIVVYPKPSHDMEKLAIEELNQYKWQVETGARKFETLATLYSDEPQIQITINRNDKETDQNLLNAAFRLKEGQVSPVIKSKLGYQIIQLKNRLGDDAVVLVLARIPQITSTEIAEARSRIDSVRSLLISGSMGFGEAVAKYSEDENAKFTGGRKIASDGSTYLKIDELDKDIVKKLDTLRVGEYSSPIFFGDEGGKNGVHIIFLISKSDPHRENMRDDYDRIAQRAFEGKKQAVMEKWFRTTIPTFYVMIDNQYKCCGNLAKWENK
jgi:peptidyl-prolyl cis-trans isomerase SurA